MLIATEEEISLPVANGEEVVKSPLMESNPDSIYGMPEASEESPATFTDVNVVPEHDKDELEQRILTLEGNFPWIFITGAVCFKLFLDLDGW